MSFPDSKMADDELILFESHPHGKSLIMPSLSLLIPVPLGMALCAWILRNLTGFIVIPLAVAVLAIVCLIVFTGFVVPTIRWIGTWVVVTDRQFLAREGFRRSRIIRLPLVRLVNAETERPLVGRVLNYGSLFIRTDQGETFTFDGIPRIKQLRGIVNELSGNGYA